MDFSLTHEQQQIRESANRFVREHAGFERWFKAVRANPSAPDPAVQGMADLGWLGLSISEEHGGFGGSSLDTMVLMEALGRGFVRFPYVDTCILAPRLLERSRSPDVLAVLAAVPEGGETVAPALGEPDGGFDLAAVATTGRREGDLFLISGEKSYVPDGPGATRFVVPVRTSGRGSERHGITLLLVDSGSPGLTADAFRAIDQRPVARARFDEVAVSAGRVLGEVDRGLELLEHAVDHAIAAELAEALGAMEAAVELTLAYIKTREQFGARIGSFQALQHRMADMAIACEEARSLVFYATGALALPPDERRRAISGAKSRVGQCALYVGHQGVQLHGGIGTSDEMAISHIMRRLRMLDMRFGNADYHASIFAGAARIAA